MRGDPPAGSTPSQLVPDVVKLSGSTADLDRADIYPMDEGSALVAAIAAAAGNEILDLAAAPGGKSLYMTHRGARVTSNDVSVARMRPLVGRSRRIVVSDAGQPPFRKRFPVVLLDAPCSATGTIRKSPELKWRLRESDLAEFAALQRRLLASAFEMTKDVLIYSTCSLEPEENDEVVAAMSGAGFERINIAGLAPDGARSWIEDGVLRLTPESGADGFTAFALRRVR